MGCCDAECTFTSAARVPCVKAGYLGWPYGWVLGYFTELLFFCNSSVLVHMGTHLRAVEDGVEGIYSLLS